MVVNLLLFDELGEILKTVKQEINYNRIQTQFKIAELFLVCRGTLICHPALTLIDPSKLFLTLGSLSRR